MTIIVSDIPKTLTVKKANDLIKKCQEQCVAFTDDLKHDLKIELETITEIGEEHSEWRDTINFHVKEIKTAVTDYKRLLKAINKAQQLHQSNLEKKRKVKK